MRKAHWQEKMEPDEAQELDAARQIKDEANDKYKIVRRKIKGRCDARIRRETEKLKG